MALADILLIRVLPPLAFAVVGYPLMGLNSEPDNPCCLLWFAFILVSALRVDARVNLLFSRILNRPMFGTAAMPRVFSYGFGL